MTELYENMRHAEVPAQIDRQSAHRPTAMTIRERSDAEARTIVDLIKGSIEQGRLLPGDRLPPEKALCVRHGASRHTVRKAMSTLERHGLVERNVGRGSFVSGPRVRAESTRMGSTDGPSWSLFELTEARLLIEPRIATLVIERATPEDHATIAQALAAIETAADWPSFKQAKYAFHSAIVRAAKNEFLSFVFEQIIASRRRSAWNCPENSAIVLDGVRSIALTESRAICDALVQGDAAAAAEAIQKSLYRILAATTA